MDDTKTIQEVASESVMKTLSLDFIDKLKADNKLLSDKVKHLENMLVSTRESLIIQVSHEEQICIKQLASLNMLSMERDLTLEEIKKFDFLVKNLKLIRKEANSIVEVSSKDVSQDELLAILDDNEQ